MVESGIVICQKHAITWILIIVTIKFKINIGRWVYSIDKMTKL